MSRFLSLLARYALAVLLAAGVGGLLKPVTASGAENSKKKAAPAATTKKVKVERPPRHDPPDAPFRRMPMSNAVRTVHLPLATNLHVAFDTELLRTHVAWTGGPPNLWGAVYHQAKDRFYCDFDGTTLWTMPPVFPWGVGEAPESPLPAAPAGTRFLGLDTRTLPASVLYELALPSGGTVRIRETPRAGSEPNVVERTFEIAPCAQPLWLLAHAVEPAKSLSFDGRSVAVATRVAFEEAVWREAKNDSELTRRKASSDLKLGWVSVPPRPNPVQVTLRSAVGPGGVTVTSTSTTTPRTMLPMGPAKTFSGEKGFSLPAGDSFYRVEHFPVPKEIELLVTGMDFLPDGNLAVCTWLGDVYIVEQATGAPAAARYRRFARGLCEPGGLTVIDGDIYVAQKQELTRLRDTDGNGEADLFECVSQDWGFTGNYHDFTFGPALDREGNFHLFRNGNRGLYEVPLMGWDIVVSRDGRTVTPFCAGLRSPNGFGSYGPDRDIFMTENQGNWMGACKLNHFQKGRFYGYPSTTPAPKDAWFDNPTKFDPPAVWFPYKLVKSASGIATIADERFGPFTGQMLVGEFQNATVVRVFLEKVNGEWQGCVWPFAKGFHSGVNRLAFGPDGRLYVGGCKNVAWAAVAPKDYSLDRVTFTGKVPFEIKEVRARRDGFELVFTAPVDAGAAANADNYDVVQYTYLYQQKYGSPEIDFDGAPDSASEVKVVGAAVSDDRLRVHLKLAGWRAGYVAMIRLLDIEGAEGQPLRNDTCYYTLNQIPK